MNKRWIVAAAVAVGVGVLTVPMLVGRTSRVEVTDPATATTAAGCKSEGKANLDFTLKRMDGADVRLSDYKGKVVLINFWATWCAPCRDEMPSIQALQRKLAGRPFAVLAVNLDEPESRIRNFLDQVKVDFTVLLDPERQVARAWEARILPASFVIGPEGRVRYSLVGEINWDHELVVSRIIELMPPSRN
jgi:peroxiredoxin